MNTETVWIIVSNIFICVINVASNWALAGFNKKTNGQTTIKIEVTANKRDNIVNIIDKVLPFIFMVSLILCVIEIVKVLDNPSGNLIENTFNLSLSISTIFFVILNALFHYTNSRTMKTINKINETQRSMIETTSGILNMIGPKSILKARKRK